MKRVVAVLVALLALFVGTGNTVAQTVGISPSTASFPWVNALGSCSMGGVSVVATPRVGYQWVGLNFNLPAAAAIAVGDGAAPIDIKLKDANIWVGALGLAAQLTPRVSLYANGEASVKKSAGAITSEEPVSHVSLFAPYSWDATGLQWWTLDGAAGVEVLPGAALLAGLRFDSLSFGLGAPRDASGDVANLPVLKASSDFQSRIWAPYVGLLMTGPGYRASLIGSPFAGSSVKVPCVFQSRNALLGATTYTGIEWRYSMLQPGGYVEGQLEYSLRLGSTAFVNLWAKASWLRISGPGNLDEIQDRLVHLVTFPPADIFSSLQGSESASATMSRSLLALGISGTLDF